MRLGRAPLTTATAAARALILAACGSGTKKPTHHTAGSRFTAYSVCMRAHGVPSFPDPTGNGGIQLPDSFDVTSPSFRSAQNTCQHKLRAAAPATSSRPGSSSQRRSVPPPACARTA